MNCYDKSVSLKPKISPLNPEASSCSVYLLKLVANDSVLDFQMLQLIRFCNVFYEQMKRKPGKVIYFIYILYTLKMSPYGVKIESTRTPRRDRGIYAVN